MKCPECFGTFEELRTRGLTLDRCGSCEALWFDRPELQAYLPKHPRWKRTKAPSHDDLRHSVRGTERRCPRCGTETLRLGSYRGAGFRKCSSCQGVLLDRKNLDFILGGKVATHQEPVVEAGFALTAGIEAVEMLATVVEFVAEVVESVVSG